MPCVDAGSAEYEYPREIDRIQKRLDHVTALLCGVLQTMSDDEIISFGSPLASWWTEHKRADLERRANEQLRRIKQKQIAQHNAEVRAINRKYGIK